MEPLPQTPPTPATRTWIVACHASSLLGFFVPAGGHILPPLIVWLMKRGDSTEVDEHGRESLNFQLSMLIYSIIAGILMFVLIGFILLPLVHVLNVVFVIIASLRASEGQLYRYPLTIRFLK